MDFSKISASIVNGDVTIKAALEAAYAAGQGKKESPLNGEYVIVRTYSAGVFFGIIESQNGKEVSMLNVRRLWYWSGAASLSQLAIDGVANPKDCKFPQALERDKLMEVIEIIPVTEKAKTSIDGVAIWKM